MLYGKLNYNFCLFYEYSFCWISGIMNCEAEITSFFSGFFSRGKAMKIDFHMQKQNKVKLFNFKLKKCKKKTCFNII